VLLVYIISIKSKIDQMYFEYKNNILNWYGVNLKNITRKVDELLLKEYNYEGPYYLYSESLLNDRLSRFKNIFRKSKFYYSVKSLSNIYILKRVKKFENFGLDVVSGAEILRGLSAGFSGEEMVYAGVGKTSHEIELGLEHKLKSFHVESISEVRQIERISRKNGVVARITARLNPDIGVNTHHYIKTGIEESKFGILPEEMKQLYDIVTHSPYIELSGLQVHLGSQIMSSAPFFKALKFLQKNASIAEKELKKEIEYLSLGGGFGINYKQYMKGKPLKEFPLEEFAQKLNEINNSPWRIDFEPGRFISAPSGVLVSNVLYIKQRQKTGIVICNAGMSDLIRPALYSAFHPILSMEIRSNKKRKYDIVGPICESGDFFAKGIDLPVIDEGDKLIVGFAGAYGSVMGSNYNSRPFIPEILVSDNEIEVIRRPQSGTDIFQYELNI